RRFPEEAWPGNGRELGNVLERALILPTGPTLHITPHPLPPPAPAAAPGGSATTPGAPVAPPPPAPHAPDQPPPSLEAVEHDHILAALRQTRWLITGPRGAAKVLGLHANTLRNRMKRLGITRPAH